MVDTKLNLINYKCTKCGASGLKLWAELGNPAIMLCVTCGCAQVGIPVEQVNPSEHMFDGNNGQANMIGTKFYPAVPVLESNGTVLHKYRFTPAAAWEHWRDLPMLAEKASAAV